jgi:hypothetical protein
MQLRRRSITYLAQLTQAQKAIAELEGRLADRSTGPWPLEGLATRVEQILRLAEEQADEIRGEAQRETPQHDDN